MRGATNETGGGRPARYWTHFQQGPASPKNTFCAAVGHMHLAHRPAHRQFPASGSARAST
eukprot:2161692-Pyramimonas_sp.AAC.1